MDTSNNKLGKQTRVSSSANTQNNLGNQTSSPWGRLGGDIQFGEDSVVLVEQFLLNMKFYLQVAAVSAGIVLFATLMSLSNVMPIGNTYVDYLASLISFVGLTYMVTCSSCIVSNITDKRSRIAEFMLPASKLQKFLARYIHLVVLIPLAAIVGLAVGDVLQMIISEIAYGSSNSIIASIIETHADYFSNNIIFNVYSVYLYLHTVLLVLGTIFRRYAWIKSNAVLWLGIITLIMLGITGLTYILDNINNNNSNITDLPNFPIEVVFFILIVLSIFNYWLAFRIYKRIQVAANGWSNL